jgi:hypothetical protein
VVAVDGEFKVNVKEGVLELEPEDGSAYGIGLSTLLALALVLLY